MKEMILANLVSALLSMFNKDLLQKFADTVLDFAEDAVLGTASEVDDRLVLPLCKLVRVTFGIPDNDEEKEA